MIKKFLICGKHLYLQSKVFELHDEQVVVVGLMLPLEKFWELEKLVQELDYMVSMNEAGGELQGMRRKIFKMAGPYAVAEKQRDWLRERSSE